MIKGYTYQLFAILLFLAFPLVIVSCGSDNPVPEEAEEILDENDVVDEFVSDFKLPNIDLNHWKVTLPIGSPTEVSPPEILDYGNNEVLKPFFYNDSVLGALVFYTYPENSTANSSYSRTELREQMEPGNNNVNWTFAQGGAMKGTLSVPEISKDDSGEFHRTIVMQIHGRLTNEQRDRIDAKDNNAPPILKIYWVDGKVRVKSKILKDESAVGDALLPVSAWGDDSGYTFKEYVGHNNFTLEVIASKGKLEVILNDQERWIKEDPSIAKWEVMENYFKAGNYLATTDNGSFARVKYFELTITHE